MIACLTDARSLVGGQSPSGATLAPDAPSVVDARVVTAAVAAPARIYHVHCATTDVNTTRVEICSFHKAIIYYHIHVHQQQLPVKMSW